ncbi:unnamed protein product [Polarella glacialis]|uniref:peptidylprolyl isomerase n=1 Tax=Polarella glacialis TaxID=89957 RepID=A0A813JII3_POLGL|nr:unnamed protein product [Polarella glacialis]|mmetsp:Transcript_1362/g.2112  ORF Transcript_1362/g.2112 Transcript_1362/m.2112 type:complete len:221 (-) Transcript_1362:143-805(-)
MSSSTEPPMFATRKRRIYRLARVAALLVAAAATVRGLCPAWLSHGCQRIEAEAPASRRLAAGGIFVALLPEAASAVVKVAKAEDNLTMIQLPSGLQYADVREGAGAYPQPGSKVTLDYVMMTTGARYGNKIDSTKDREAPYRFVLGDPSIIRGLSEALLTMKPGGVRRVIIPAKLGYTDESKKPQPPGPGEFQRFKNIYLNSNRAYQPDLVMDLKLFQPS